MFKNKNGLWLSLSCLIAAPSFAAAPVFTSSITATPAQGVVGQAVTFSVAAEEPGAVLTFTWDFGDGTTATGASVQHTYAATGIYNIKVTVADPQGNQIRDRLALAVVNPGAVVLSMSFSKATGKIYRTQTGKDTLSFSGTLLAVPADGSPANRQVSVNIHGLATTFAVNERGQGKRGDATIKFKLKKNFSGGDIPFSFKLTKATLLPTAVAAGLDTTVNFDQGLSLLVDISIGSANAAFQLRGSEGVDIQVLAILAVAVFFNEASYKLKISF